MNTIEHFEMQVKKLVDRICNSNMSPNHKKKELQQLLNQIERL